MPVERFRSFEEAREALWGEPGDPAYLRQIAWLWAFAARVAPRRYPRGVHRYESIDAANRARDEWDLIAGGKGPDTSSQ